MSKPAQSSGAVVPHSLRWHGELIAAAVYVFLRFLSATLRMRLVDSSEGITEARKGPVIMALWHNRLSLSLPAYRHFFTGFQPHRRAVALISASKDGAIVARLMEHYGFHVVRGSSSRRGAQALRELTFWTRRGYDVAITPDGPRGPKYEVKEGIMMLAQLTGLPVVPISAQIHSKKVFGSWDAFQLPLPFARCDIRVGQPVRVPRESGPEEREMFRRTIQERMMELTIE